MNDTEIIKKINDLGSKMDELAPYALPGCNEPDREAKMNEYYRIMNERNEYRDKLRAYFDKAIDDSEGAITRSDDAIRSLKPFANGFGEATDRYITCSTYERSQKRIEKEIASFMNGWR